MHRTLRQNLALAACQCLALLAQLRHIDWCIAALHYVRRQRQHDPALSWKQAQKLAAEETKHTLLTEHVAVALDAARLGVESIVMGHSSYLAVMRAAPQAPDMDAHPEFFE